MARWTIYGHYEVKGKRKREDVRPTTLACSAALFPVCDVPSSLQIFLRSLLMSVRERSVMPAAICCKLDAMTKCGHGALSLPKEEVDVEVMWNATRLCRLGKALGAAGRRVCSLERRRRVRGRREGRISEGVVRLFLPAVRRLFTTS
jgi:hypothetical protein